MHVLGNTVHTTKSRRKVDQKLNNKKMDVIIEKRRNNGVSIFQHSRVVNTHCKYCEDH